MSASPLVSPQWLWDRRKDPNVVVADVRWYLRGKRGLDAYAQGHIPHAYFVNLDEELAALPGEGRPGRHPLPAERVFAQALARMNVQPGTLVVAYDDAGGSVAARLWWLMRYFGLDGGRVLDGGFQAWTAAGLEVSTDRPTFASAAPPPIRPRPEMVVDKRGVRTFVAEKQALLLDARARERYEGRVEPIDSRPGHIPGAKNAPHSENLAGPGGAFRSAAELAELYRSLGLERERPVIAYCGSGVTACHALLALALIGREDALLYEGSWSDWASDASLPVETSISPRGT